jgi:hypothetical protein
VWVGAWEDDGTRDSGAAEGREIPFPAVCLPSGTTATVPDHCSD